MSEQGAGFAAIRVVGVGQNFIQDYLGLLVFTLSDTLFGQFHPALAETIECGRVRFSGAGGLGQIAQRHTKIFVRLGVLFGAQLSLSAGQDFFASWDVGLTTGSFAISNFFYVLRLHDRGQAKDQSRHDESEYGGGVFHSATGFTGWADRSQSVYR